MNDPTNEEPSALLRMAMRIYNSGYHAGHHDTVEAGYVDIHSCDMENYHEDEAEELVKDFLESNLTETFGQTLGRILAHQDISSNAKGMGRRGAAPNPSDG